MNPALWAALGGAAALLLVLLGAGVTALLVVRRARRREAAADAAAATDLAALRARVEELSAELAEARLPATGARADYVITTAGDGDRDDVPQVRERAVLSVTLGEPLVKLAAFGYGLRRALAPETRNRIAFEMRREVRRARKARRRAARRTRVTTPEEEAA